MSTRRRPFAMALFALATATGAAAPAAEPPPRPDLVRVVRLKLSAADLASAAAWVEDWKRDYGVDTTYLDALGWLARGAVMLGQPELALRYAGEVRAAIPVATPERLGALGAAIEAEAQVRAARDGRGAAAHVLEGELRLSDDVAFRSRLWKNINRLLLEGQPAPELQWTLFVGSEPVPFAALRGRPVVLFFWAHWCGDCRAQAASLARLRERWGKDVAFVAPTRLYGTAKDNAPASAEEEVAHMAAVLAADYAALGPLPVPIATDTMVRYGVSATPTFVLVDRAGRVRLYAPTRLTEEELERRIRELVAEPAP